MSVNEVTPHALSLEEVSHSYGALRAVDDVSLAIAPGELVCLLGPSGCGKTTVLRLAAGLEELQRGRVLIDGALVADAKGQAPPESRSVGLMFQDYALFPHLSAGDNVAFGLRALAPEARRRRVAGVLEQVGMAGEAGAFPHTLSGGQQQRVALARALAPEPHIMLLDEPFTGLDTRLRNQIRDDTLHLLKSSGAATLMVTHDPEEAMFMADRIALMRAGRIVQLGRPDSLYFQPADAFAASFFGDVNRLEGRVAGGRVRTALGDFAAAELAEGTAVEVLIRPEALKLDAAAEVEASGTARVLASRLLGRTSLVHLSLADGSGQDLHLHARVPGRFLPAEDQFMKVCLDRSQAFVFALSEAT